MLFSDPLLAGIGLLVIIGIVIVSSWYAYYVDSNRPDDDPRKKNYQPLAILLAPITFPLFVLLAVALFILRVAAYGAFAILFILAMIFIRKPFILEWLKKTALTFGDLLMQANTFLVRIFMRTRLVPAARHS